MASGTIPCAEALVVDTVTKAVSFSTYQYETINVAKAGYKPVGIAFWNLGNGSGYSQALPYIMNIDIESEQANVGFRYVGSSSTNFTLTLGILYVKR